MLHFISLPKKNATHATNGARNIVAFSKDVENTAVHNNGNATLKHAYLLPTIDTVIDASTKRNANGSVTAYLFASFPSFAA